MRSRLLQDTAAVWLQINFLLKGGLVKSEYRALQICKREIHTFQKYSMTDITPNPTRHPQSMTPDTPPPIDNKPGGLGYQRGV